jgi:hypothetical protein
LDLGLDGVDLTLKAGVIHLQNTIAAHAELLPVRRANVKHVHDGITAVVTRSAGLRRSTGGGHVFFFRMADDCERGFAKASGFKAVNGGRRVHAGIIHPFGCITIKQFRFVYNAHLGV